MSEELVEEPKKGRKKGSDFITDETFDDIADAVAKSQGIVSVNLKRGKYVENTVSSGSLALDVILGGGWPGGRWSAGLGPEASGKSTLSFFSMKHAVDQQIPVFHFDPEGAMDPSFVSRIGLRTDWSKEKKEGRRVFYRYQQISYGEQFYHFLAEFMKRLPDSDGKRIQAMFVLDSIPAMPSKRRMEDPSSSPMASAARMHSECIPLIEPLLGAKNCVLYTVNQLRMKPGVMYGDPTYEVGGETLKYASDLRLRVTKRANPDGGGSIEEEACWDGRGQDKYNYVLARTVKNKVFSPFRETWLRLWFEEKGRPGRGIDPFYDLYQYLTMTGQVEENRGYFKIKVPGYKGSERITWAQMKALVLDPAAKSDEGTDIITLCRKQFPTSEAFERYFNTLSGEGVSLDPKQKPDDETQVAVTEDEVEQEEASEVAVAPVERKRRGRPPLNRNVINETVEASPAASSFTPPDVPITSEEPVENNKLSDDEGRMPSSGEDE